MQIFSLHVPPLCSNLYTVRPYTQHLRNKCRPRTQQFLTNSFRDLSPLHKLLSQSWSPSSFWYNALIFYPDTALKLNYCEDCTALELKVLAVLTALELKKIGKDRSSPVPCWIRSRLLIRYWILPSNKGVQAYDQSNLPPWNSIFESSIPPWNSKFNSMNRPVTQYFCAVFYGIVCFWSLLKRFWRSKRYDPFPDNLPGRPPNNSMFCIACCLPVQP